MTHLQPTPFVIAIGRQYGSGGRQLAALLARRLGIGYFDRELLEEAARRTGMSPQWFERHDERYPQFLSGVFAFAHGYQSVNAWPGNSATSPDAAYRAIDALVRQIAAEQSCVIVGRTADYILRDHPRTASVFVHAPIERRVARMMSRGDIDDPAHARALALRTDKLRADYYNFYTDKRWGAAGSYHLTLDSSVLTLDQMADTVVDHIRRRGFID